GRQDQDSDGQKEEAHRWCLRRGVSDHVGQRSERRRLRPAEFAGHRRVSCARAGAYNHAQGARRCCRSWPGPAPGLADVPLAERPMKTIRVGLVGSQFVSTIHLEALRSVPAAEVVAVASATEAHARAFAERHGIPRWFTDYRKMYEMPDLDMVVLGLPNDLHCGATVSAAAAGKHVLCEKPLCLNLAEADRMIDACRAAGVKLMYAEELCFTPKYVRLKYLIDEGALGRIHLVKQAEKHDGPHAAWFWDVQRSGGGVTMDMGCHAIEFFRWLLGGRDGGKARVRSVYADMGTHVHGGRTRGDDNSTLILKLDDE